MPGDRTYRVIVHGKFDGLDEAAVRTLRADADSHTLFDAAFSDEGSIVYDADLRFFTFRCQAYGAGPQSEREALRSAQNRAAAYLTGRGWGFRDLRADAMSMDDMRVHRKGR
jgi:hypothetical protein